VLCDWDHDDLSASADSMVRFFHCYLIWQLSTALLPLTTVTRLMVSRSASWMQDQFLPLTDPHSLAYFMRLRNRILMKDNAREMCSQAGLTVILLKPSSPSRYEHAASVLHQSCCSMVPKRSYGMFWCHRTTPRVFQMNMLTLQTRVEGL
jgi:hypothetical protein